MELFLSGFILGMICHFLIGLFMLLKSNNKEFNKYNKNDFIQLPLLAANHVIKSRSCEILGYYNEIPINRDIILDDGSIFVYDSIAHKNKKGFYLIDPSIEKFIIVDDLFVYKSKTSVK